MEVVEFSRPVGYVFDPTDCELVGFYLSKKIANQLIPGIDYFIPEYNLYGSKEPWQIWNFFKPRLGEERDDQDLYFFTKLKKKTLKGSRIDRSVGTGTWQGEDGGTEIVSNNQRIGSKKRFRYENKDSNQHGGWIMHEYSLDSSLLLPDQHNNYVVCRIRKNHLALKRTIEESVKKWILKRRRRVRFKKWILNHYHSQHCRLGVQPPPPPPCCNNHYNLKMRQSFIVMNMLWLFANF
ncbi:hypothetical protein Patl1_19847 [Pistacia atlantica]|uniref:Uncharacterized protein n=1 Tax=Pistacia atlantica TaxID=434234 RepID=A0ACC1BK61_9ROSI|nr:hypothetical protein Patl1_19847 [Pistacia atlantica]